MIHIYMVNCNKSTQLYLKCLCSHPNKVFIESYHLIVFRINKHLIGFCTCGTNTKHRNIKIKYIVTEKKPLSKISCTQKTTLSSS